MVRLDAKIALLAVALGFAGTARAGSYTAASCSYADVNAVINGPTHTAVDGDTIDVPAGTCTWSSGLSISGVCLSIVGAGAGSTVIVDSLDDAATPLIQNTAVPYASCNGGDAFRISAMTVEPDASVTNGFSPIVATGSCTAGGCPNLRVDHMAFSNWTEAGNGTQSSWMVRTDNLFGVLDHNTVDTETLLANVNHSAYLGVGQFGDNSWSQPDSFGTANALFIESNTLAGAAQDCDISDGFSDIGGCRVVVRDNVFDGTFVGAYVHGNDTTGRPRGGRQVEFYDNSVTCTNTTNGCDSAVTMRSGVLLNFGNTYTTTTGSWFNSFVSLYVFRSFASLDPDYGSCDGSGPFDTNDGTVYASGTYDGASGSTSFVDSTQSWTANQWISAGHTYSLRNTTQGWGGEIASNTATAITYINEPVIDWSSQTPGAWTNGDRYQILRATVCMDQSARSGGELVSGDPPTPVGPLGETLDPVYEWNDTLSAGSTMFHDIIDVDTDKLLLDRDYYYEEASFAGASGTGSGLLAARPSTCTPMVAYWATDTSTLYQCTAANTWTAYYTPYVFPHPLSVGASTSGSTSAGTSAAGASSTAGGSVGGTASGGSTAGGGTSAGASSGGVASSASSGGSTAGASSSAASSSSSAGGTSSTGSSTGARTSSTGASSSTSAGSTSAGHGSSSGSGGVPDAGAATSVTGGCGCGSASGGDAAFVLLLGAGLVALRRRRTVGC